MNTTQTLPAESSVSLPVVAFIGGGNMSSALLGGLLASGAANVGVTEADGITCLKLTLLNPTVNLQDVKVLLESVKACGQQLLNA